MQTIPEAAVMLALFGLGGEEYILVFAILVILFGRRHLPELARGLAQGLFQFRDATKRVRDEMDDEASQAGRSVGGIYGKPVLQALTPDNQVAERYDLDHAGQNQPPGLTFVIRLWKCLRRLVRAILKVCGRE